MISFESDSLKQYELKSPDYDYIERTIHVECQSGRFQKKKNGVWENNSAAKKKSKALLMFTGDLLCQEKQIADAATKNGYDFTYEFDYVKGILQQADLVVGNLETPLFPGAPYRSERYVAEKKFYNNAPVEYLDALKYAGFDVLTTANNHDLDTGAVGLGETIRNVEKYGFIQTGTFREQKKKYEIINVQGFKIAITSFTDSHNELYQNLTEEGTELLLNQYTFENARRVYRQAKEDGAELVFAMMHWGMEYKTEPLEKQKKYAAELVQIGYDYIVGSHPHVLQPFDKLAGVDKSVPIVYSMGNFVSHQDGTRTSNTIILCVTLLRKEKGIQILNSYIPCMNCKSLHNKKYILVPTQLQQLPEKLKRELAGAEKIIQQDIGKKIPLNKMIERKEVDPKSLKWKPCVVRDEKNVGETGIYATNPEPIEKYQKLLHVTVGKSTYKPSASIEKTRRIAEGNAEFMRQMAYQHNSRVQKLLTKKDPKLTQKQIDEIYRYWDTKTNGLYRPDVAWYQLFYARTKQENPQFIDPAFFYFLLLDRLNDERYSAFRHKGYLAEMFPSWQMKTVAMKIKDAWYDENLCVIDEESFLTKIAACDKEMIIRPALGISGEKSTKRLAPLPERPEIEKAIANFKNDFIVQEKAAQHEKLASMTAAGALNYVQILTILDKGTVMQVSAVLKDGATDELVCGIDSKGAFRGVPAGNIPCFDKILAFTEEMHRKLPMFAAVRWNVTVDTAGTPVLLDFNVGYTELVSPQIANGPLFGEYTDRVIDMVMENYSVTGYEPGFVYEIYRDYCVVNGLNRQRKVFDVPDNYLGRPVSELRAGAFEGDSYIKKIVFGANMTKISRGVCKNCTALEGVRIRSKMTKLIESEAFYGCTRMTNCFISTSVERIESKAFAACKELRSVKIPNNVTYIAPDAFAGCKKLTIYGRKDSYAQKYAKQQAIPFVIFDRLDINI